MMLTDQEYVAMFTLLLPSCHVPHMKACPRSVTNQDSAVIGCARSVTADDDEADDASLDPAASVTAAAAGLGAMYDAIRRTGLRCCWSSVTC